VKRRYRDAYLFRLSFMPLIDTLLSRLLLFDVNAKSEAVLGEKEVTIKENDHVTSRNA
jgi:hypothetical protein